MPPHRQSRTSSRVPVIREDIMFRAMIALRTLVCMAWLVPCAAIADPCEPNQQTKTTFPTTVHRQPPTFSTGQGWTLAPVLKTLPTGTTVWICERRFVGFIGGRRLWLRIQFDEPRQEGWIPGEDTLGARTVDGTQNALGQWMSRLFVSRARADDGPVSPSTGSDLALSEEYRPGAWQLPVFYFVMFVFVLFGIAAKSVFDNFKPGVSFWTCLGNSPRAFVVAPIVVLFVARATDAGLGSLTSGTLITFLTAFQNGFFWQTVLVKADDGPPSRTPAENGGVDRPAALVPAGRGTA